MEEAPRTTANCTTVPTPRRGHTASNVGGRALRASDGFGTICLTRLPTTPRPMSRQGGIHAIARATWP